MTQVFLLGNLASHRRRRILEELLQAQVLAPSSNQLDAAGRSNPPQGICLLFGTDYQASTEEQKREWLFWYRKPGRSLVLVPPFEPKEIGAPTDWRINYRVDLAQSSNEDLALLLQSETQLELKGTELQFDINQGHRWEDYSLNTAYFKPHGHSGLFAATVLPLWSISLLRKGQQLRDWLEALHGLAGAAIPQEQQSADDPPEDSLRPEHYALLVHLWALRTELAEDALAALENSDVIRLPPDQAASLLSELSARKLLLGGQLTDTGTAVLKSSAYWMYAQAMRGETL